MEIKDHLTNEIISKRFVNQFDLVNYAISVAEEMIHVGRAPRVKTETENPALQVLEEIAAGKDIFEEKKSKEEGSLLHTTVTEKMKTDKENIETESALTE